MADLRFFKCNVLGGFRLSDISKQVKQNEYFFLDSHIVETSRSTVAALRERWMIEVTEKEASNFLNIPKQAIKENIQKEKTVSGLAVPNMTEINKKLESRQAEANFKPILPNFKEVEEKQKSEKRDSINHIGASTDKELLKGMKDIELVATPDFSKTAEKIEIVKEPIIEKIVEDDKINEVISTELVEENKIEENIPKDLVKESVIVQSIDTVTSLVDDKMFDNTLVSTPNFDEKKEEEVKAEIKKEVKKDIEKAVEKKKKNEGKKKKETIFDKKSN